MNSKIKIRINSFSLNQKKSAQKYLKSKNQKHFTKSFSLSFNNKTLPSHVKTNLNSSFSHRFYDWNVVSVIFKDALIVKREGKIFFRSVAINKRQGKKASWKQEKKLAENKNELFLHYVRRLFIFLFLNKIKNLLHCQKQGILIFVFLPRLESSLTFDCFFLGLGGKFYSLSSSSTYISIIKIRTQKLMNK